MEKDFSNDDTPMKMLDAGRCLPRLKGCQVSKATDTDSLRFGALRFGMALEDAAVGQIQS